MCDEETVSEQWYKILFPKGRDKYLEANPWIQTHEYEPLCDNIYVSDHTGEQTEIDVKENG